MAYTKHTWVTGETITAANLNHLEDGVEAIAANGAIGTVNLANGAVTAAKLGESATDIVADTFSTSTAYSVGDYCIYSGALYRFTADKTAGAWDSTKVTAVALADDVTSATRSTQRGILNNYIIDQVVLDSTGYPASGYSASSSYSGKTSADASMPFYKTRPIYNAWYPTSNLNGSYRYIIMTPPTSIAGKKYQIGFWLYNDLSASKNFKFGIIPSRNSFDAIYQSTAKVGAKWTVGTATLLIDGEYNGWLHFTATVDDSSGTNNTTGILLGSTKCLTTETVKFTPPVITIGEEQEWFVNYRNPTYDPDKLIDDTGTSASKTWSSNKIASEISSHSHLTGKKVNWIGDSIFYGGGSGGNDGWIGRIADAYGVTFESLAANGAMIIDPNTSGYYSIATHCTSFTETAPDYVIFDGGTNDGFNKTISPLGEFSTSRYDEPTDKTTSFSTAFEYIIWQFLSTYPNAKIGYVIPYKQISYNSNIDTYDITGKAYFDRAIEICKKWGIPYLDLREKTPLNYQVDELQTYFTDFVHINGNGYDLTYNIVAEWMNTL